MTGSSRTLNRWSRRHRDLSHCAQSSSSRDVHVSNETDRNSAAQPLCRTAQEATECCAERQEHDEQGSAGELKSNMPSNLQILLDSDLNSIKTGSTCSTLPEHGVVDLGGLMAQHGLFPRSKMASAQSLILENGLANSFSRVLQGGARHLRGVFGHESNDLGLFDALRKELGRGEGPWSRGTMGSARIKWSVPGLNGCGLLDGEIVQDLQGNELPAFSFVLRSLAESVDAEMLSWWANIYEEGNVALGFHHDHQSSNNGLRWGRIFDVTAGASFGACRDLTFRHVSTGREFSFPQANGDIFAFDTQTDQEFMHGMYRVKERCGPRISVIIAGKSRNS